MHVVANRDAEYSGLRTIDLVVSRSPEGPWLVAFEHVVRAHPGDLALDGNFHLSLPWGASLIRQLVLRARSEDAQVWEQDAPDLVDAANLRVSTQMLPAMPEEERRALIEAAITEERGPTS